MIGAVFLKMVILGAGAFFTGMHLAQAKNPDYENDVLGSVWHRVIAVVFIIGIFLGSISLLADIFIPAH